MNINQILQRLGLEAKFEESSVCSPRRFDIVVFYNHGKRIGFLEYLKNPVCIHVLDDFFAPYATKLEQEYKWASAHPYDLRTIPSTSKTK